MGVSKNWCRQGWVSATVDVDKGGCHHHLVSVTVGEGKVWCQQLSVSATVNVDKGGCLQQSM